MLCNDSLSRQSSDANSASQIGTQARSSLTGVLVPKKEGDISFREGYSPWARSLVGGEE